MRLRLSALERRSPALAEAVRRAGRVDGLCVEIRREDYELLSTIHLPASARRCQCCFGLGDLVRLFAWPLAKPLGLKNCVPCDKRRKALNRVLRVCWG